MRFINTNILTCSKHALNWHQNVLMFSFLGCNSGGKWTGGINIIKENTKDVSSRANFGNRNIYEKKQEQRSIFCARVLRRETSTSKSKNNEVFFRRESNIIYRTAKYFCREYEVTALNYEYREDNASTLGA